MYQDIVICIPAYNPTEDLIQLVDNLIQNKFTVVVINDGSSSKSNNIFNKLNKNVILLKHKINQGKGSALKTGFKYIHKNLNCKGVVIADADGQHLLKDIIAVSDNVKDGALTLGIRNVSEMPFRSKFGNSITRVIFKVVTKCKITDTQTGLRGIPFSLLPKFIEISGDRYEYEINMLIYCTQNDVSIIEIPIATVYDENNSSSSFNVISDSAKIYKCIIANSKLRNIILYVLSSIIAFIIDFILLFVFKNIFSYIQNEHTLLLVSVVLARVVSSSFNFVFNKFLVFENKNTNFIKEFFEYYGLVIIILTINYILLDVLAVNLNINLIIAKMVVETFLFIANYIIQKLFIFKEAK